VTDALVAGNSNTFAASINKAKTIYIVNYHLLSEITVDFDLPPLEFSRLVMNWMLDASSFLLL